MSGAKILLTLWLSLATAALSGGDDLRTDVTGSSVERWVSVGGVWVHYYETKTPRSSERTPLLFIHGWLGSSYDYLPLLNALGPHVSVVVPDLPGHGDSQKTDIHYSNDYFMEFIRDFIVVLGMPRVVLVGHSMGGGMAVNFAVRYPQLVEKLVLIDPDGLAGEEGFLGFVRRLNLLVELGVYLNNRPAIKWVTKRTVFHDPSFVTEEYLDAVAATCLSREGRRAQIQITREVLGSAPVDEMLPRLRLPTLIFWGDKDRVLDPKWATEYRSRIAGAELVMVPDAGHVPQVEAPHTVARRLEQFVDGRAGDGVLGPP